MTEYIEREALVNNLELLARHEDRFTQSVVLGVVGTIRSVKAADVVPVVHARWIEGGSGIIICPKCNRGYNLVPQFTHYCPNCGAKMDGGAENG